MRMKVDFHDSIEQMLMLLIMMMIDPAFDFSEGGAPAMPIEKASLGSHLNFRFPLSAFQLLRNDFTGSGFGTLVPHFLQVRRSSSLQKSTIALLNASTISAQSKQISSTSA